ncbi:MAG: hypothetical protein WCJ30_03880, partial [Deltaproteobacteria bacterium]
RADPRWTVMFGGSRGGGTALEMASNPLDAPYRVVLAAAMAAPTRLGDHALLTSPTYPGLVYAAGWTIGLADAWRTGWTYPSCARPEMVGLNSVQAALQIMTGTSDPTTANDQHSADSPRFLDGLARAGTQLHLQVSASDDIIPHALQVRYALSLMRRGIAADMRMLIRSGHTNLLEPGHAAATYEEIVRAALLRIVDPAFDRAGPVPTFVTPGLALYRVDRASGTLQPLTLAAGATFPFSIDLPFRVARGEHVPLVAVGEPGTTWRLTFSLGGTPALVNSGVIDADYSNTVFVDLGPAAPVGAYDCVLEIRRPGGTTWESIDPTHTPSGDPCLVHVEAAEPATDHGGAATWTDSPSVPAFPSTAWGLSEY